MNIYVAVAYRWGWSNCGWHTVAVSTDRESVVNAARAEAGQNSGVAVTVYPAAYQVAYFPSGRGEKGPEFCCGKNENERIGCEVKLRFVLGEFDPPEWLRKVIDAAAAETAVLEAVELGIVPASGTRGEG